MAYDILWLKKGFACRFYDDVTDRELLTAMTSFHNDPRSENSKFIVVDICRSRPLISEETLIYAAALDNRAVRAIPNLRMGLVFANEEQGSALDQYLEHSMHTSWIYKTFTDFDSALVWAHAS